LELDDCLAGAALRDNDRIETAGLAAVLRSDIDSVLLTGIKNESNMNKVVDIPSDVNFKLRNVTDVDTTYAIMPSVTNHKGIHAALPPFWSKMNLDLPRLKMWVVMYGDGTTGIDIHPRESFNSRVRDEHHAEVVRAVAEHVPSAEQANTVIACTPVQHAAYLGSSTCGIGDIYLCDFSLIFKEKSPEVVAARELAVLWHRVSLQEWPTAVMGARRSRMKWLAIGASRSTTRHTVENEKTPTHDTWQQGQPNLKGHLLAAWEERLRNPVSYNEFLRWQRPLMVSKTCSFVNTFIFRIFFLINMKIFCSFRAGLYRRLNIQ
jgi:hypothetical protein